jgi:glucuronosyltransferase
LQDIEDYLNGAEHGVIYFNMGSMIRADTLPDDMRDAFLQAFSEMPQRVLWKWENSTLPGQPKNVKIAKWLPQFDILSTQTHSVTSYLTQFRV